MGRMEADEVEEALADTDLVVCLQAPLPEAKQLRDACLAAEIPVLLDRGACCGKSGCGCAPKLELRARPEDVPRVARLFQDRWQALLAREGTMDDDPPAAAAATDGEHTPCPACGTAAP